MNRLLISLLSIAVLGLIFWKVYGEDWLKKSQETEAKAILASVYTAEKSFFKEYGRYSMNFNELGFRPEGKFRFQLYLKTQDLPENLKKAFDEKDLPFADNLHFRAVAYNESRKILFTITETGEIKKVEK